MKRPANRRSGFALAAVLWLLAGLTVIVAAISDVAQTSAERVAQLRERVDFMQSAYSTRGHVLYWLSGTGTGVNSFNDGVQGVRADGTQYTATAGSTVGVQDIGGLIALNAPNRPVLAKLLADCGVDRVDVDSLLDALEDYIDPDDFPRVNGAENELYAAKSMPPPRNAPLLSVQELWSVYGWAAQRPTLTSHGCTESLTAESSIGRMLNLATATRQALQAGGVPDQLLDTAISRRSDPAALLSSLGILSDSLGRENPFGANATAPVQRTVRVTHRQVDGQWQLDYTLRLTPELEGRPWQIVEPHLHSTMPVVAATPSRSASTPAAEPAAPALPWPAKPPAAQSSDVSTLLSF